MPDETFVDFYELMQISPNAEPDTIHRVYRMLATRFHPDNPETGNMDRFLILNKAHRILSDPDARALYDIEHQSRRVSPIGIFGLKDFAIGIDGEANRRMGVLCLLYNRRRSDPDRPGLSVLELETIMILPREHLLFTLWYLKEKDLVRMDQNSDYVISSSGADYVEERLPSHRVLYKLLKDSEQGSARDRAPFEAQAGSEDETEDGAGADPP